MTNSKTSEAINNLKDEIIQLVTKLFSEFEHKENFDFKTGWATFEAETQKTLKDYLQKKFSDAKVEESKTKNDYPDLKLSNSEGLFAIDIKASVGGKSSTAAFDMARIDTVVEERINKFVEEWELIIKYEKATGKLVKVYFGLFREMVGQHKYSKGVKYRLKDGNMRPKNWKDMDNNVIYWKSKDEYLNAIRTSFKYRWIALISKIVVPELNEEEKTQFKNLFDNPIDLPEEPDEEVGDDENQ